MTERPDAPKARRAPPRLDLTDVEWKLGLGAALASVFTAAWFAVAQPMPAATPPAPVVAVVAPSVSVARAPVSATPARVAPSAPPPRARSAVTTVAVARPRRAARVRTRSS
ncbi:MAG: hypothetical protein EPO40_32540 [Myxococcaceae bacterium]|nr:MAG: hypothetical protein EPO40_32540 [Myxococcaceae bacterium]